MDWPEITYRRGPKERAREPQIFGPRISSDAIYLRADLTTGSALANQRALLVSGASMESDSAKHVADVMKDLLREGLGMLDVLGRAVDEELGRLVS
ncbi:hypothetical protein [Mitsuaria sp. 7]|uniref:hypothetical protein n=1 Tax=Mitsuaria sp. 7 TaxID=1658665 RepID=UPI0007DD09BD|nr:hypothetical protein [Mitsuaria sp. 7]ANH67760.1 hypothetical protein ABE85_09555 [Mitsuaria sp. 7]